MARKKIIKAEDKVSTYNIVEQLEQFKKEKHLSNNKVINLIVSESNGKLGRQYVFELINNTIGLFTDKKRIMEIERILNENKEREWYRETYELRVMYEHLFNHYGVTMSELDRRMGKCTTWLSSKLSNSKKYINVDTHNEIVDAFIKFEEEQCNE